MRTSSTPDVGTQDLSITRIFDAPRAVVFKVWTESEHVAKWWGPYGFTNPVCEVDARPGGAIRIDMRGPDGVVYPMGGIFHEIDDEANGPAHGAGQGLRLHLHRRIVPGPKRERLLFRGLCPRPRQPSAPATVTLPSPCRRARTSSCHPARW